MQRCTHGVHDMGQKFRFHTQVSFVGFRCAFLARQRMLFLPESQDASDK